MKLLKIALACSCLVLFWACSQSVSSPDKDSRGDDELLNIPGFNRTGDKESAKGSSANVGSESSNSNGGGQSSESYDFPDDGFESSSSGSSGKIGLDITQYMPDGKMDCKFTVDDDVWEMGYEGADTTMHAVIEYKPDGYVWVDLTAEYKMASSDECNETAGVFMFMKMLMEASPESQMDIEAACDGSNLSTSFNGKTDEKYTPQSKQEDYNERCL